MKYEVQYPSEYIYGLNGCIPTFILHTSYFILNTFQVTQVRNLNNYPATLLTGLPPINASRLEIAMASNRFLASSEAHAI